MTHTHTLTCSIISFPPQQVNLTLCVTTSARCSCTCALWTEPAASPVTPARPTATSWTGGVCSVRPSNRRPAPSSVGGEIPPVHLNTRRMMVRFQKFKSNTKTKEKSQSSNVCVSSWFLFELSDSTWLCTALSSWPMRTDVPSPAGYDFSRWTETLLRLGQTKVFFSTTASLPYRSESPRPTPQSLRKPWKQGLITFRGICTFIFTLFYNFFIN